MAKRRLTLGKHGAMTAEQARKAAQEALARIRLGGRIRKQIKTVSGLL
jgi:Arm DNA-binding domain